jgi:class 3 adenylate cyclase
MPRVVRLAGDRDDLRFTSIGEVRLKGMSAPIEAYEALPSSAGSAASPR